MIDSLDPGIVGGVTPLNEVRFDPCVDNLSLSPMIIFFLFIYKY
jgi:hypothetical protein